jgi:DNA ligase 1
MPFILLFLLFFAQLLHASSPPIQLATKYHEDIIVSQYWVSEKLDGIRAYWDGKHLISRQGNPFSAPHWFTKGFPNMAIDGELWIARGAFEETSGIVRTKSGGAENWKKVSFMIFDLPASLTTFTHRLTIMEQLVTNSPSLYLKMIPQQKFTNHQTLKIKLDQVIEGGGEGLMLHHINAYYQVKRSHDLMKLKRYDDAEAVVLGYIAGKGKHLGRMGSLLVKNSENINFKIGTGFTDDERASPPAIGDIITYQYIGKTKKGIPRFASYLRIRTVAAP